VIVGGVLLAAAAVFHVCMPAMAPKSNAPATMMRTLGQAAGIVGGLRIATIIVGIIGGNERRCGAKT
jgi:hypothetical protein